MNVHFARMPWPRLAHRESPLGTSVQLCNLHISQPGSITSFPHWSWTLLGWESKDLGRMSYREPRCMILKVLTSPKARPEKHNQPNELQWASCVRCWHQNAWWWLGLYSFILYLFLKFCAYLCVCVCICKCTHAHAGMYAYSCQSSDVNHVCLRQGFSWPGVQQICSPDWPVSLSGLPVSTSLGLGLQGLVTKLSFLGTRSSCSSLQGRHTTNWTML